MPAVVCPQCDKDDRIAKVSAIHASGTTTDAALQTDLAQRLAPPGAGCLWYVIGFVPFLNVLLMWFAPVKQRTRLIMAALFVAAIAVPIIAQLTAGPGKGFSYFVVVAAVLLFVLVQVVYVAGLVEGSKAPKAKWSALYYCARNDCVFDPATGRVVPSNRMKELLH